MTNQPEQNIEHGPAGVEWTLLFGKLLTDKSASKLSNKSETDTGNQIAIKTNNENTYNEANEFNQVTYNSR